MKKPVLELTDEAFEPFGKVINSPQNDSSLFPGFISSLGVVDLGGSTECEISRCVMAPTDVIEWMERHFRTQEAFVAMERNVWHAVAGRSETATILVFFMRHAARIDWEMQQFTDGAVIEIGREDVATAERPAFSLTSS